MNADLSNSTTGVFYSRRRSCAIRVLAFVEATTVTGPVKNLLEFVSTCPQGALEMSFATFLRGGATRSNPFIDSALGMGVQVYPIPEGFRFDPRIVGGLRNLIRELDPDIIQTHASKSHVVMSASGMWKHFPWIGFHHGDSWPRWRSRFYNRLAHRSLRYAAQVVAVSEASKRYLVGRGLSPQRIAVVHNAVQVPGQGRAANREQQRLSLKIPSRAEVVLAIGRLSPEKGHLDLIEALRRFRHSFPERNAVLIILGDGPERARLESAVDSAKLENSVRLQGHVQDVRAYYDIADLFVLPSISEGSPNVLLEALSAGVPVVATSVGGIPEMVRDGESAILVKPRSPVDMAQAMHRLLTDHQLRETIAANGRRIVETGYSPERRAQELLDLYVSTRHSQNN